MFESCFGSVGTGLPNIAWLVRWQGARTQSKLQAIYLDKFADCESVEHGQDLVEQVHPIDSGQRLFVPPLHQQISHLPYRDSPDSGIRGRVSRSSGLFSRDVASIWRAHACE